MSIYKDIVEGYQLNNIQEKDKLNNVLVQLNEKDDQEMINRKNFIGHFTASAFVISKDNRRLLMVHHNILKRYLQPGGHIDKNDRNKKIILETLKKADFGIYDIFIKKTKTKASSQIISLIKERNLIMFPGHWE